MKRNSLILSAILSLANFLFVSPCFAQLTSKGKEQIVSYSGNTAAILNNKPVNPNLLTNTGTNTFIMNVNPPANAVRIYVSNETANACNNLTLSIASTGNNFFNSFNSFTFAWQTVQVAGTGAFAASQALTLPANGTVAITSQPIIGNKIAIFLVLSAGCATTNVDMQAVFGSFSPPNSFVQGPVAPGASYTGFNPVVIGGVDLSGNVQNLTAYTPAGSGNAGPGLGIGEGNAPLPLANNNASTRTDWPNGQTNGGPLAVGLMGVAPALSGWTIIPVMTNSTTAVCNTTSFGCPGLYVADAGLVTFSSQSVGSGTNTFLLAQDDLANGSVVQTCRIDASITNTAGTTPTLDLYIQDSPNNTNWTDRVHFPQVTTGTQRLWTTLSGSQPQSSNSAAVNTLQAITTYTDATLAANTVLQGSIGKYIRMKTVAAGTSPAYTVRVDLNCK